MHSEGRAAPGLRWAARRGAGGEIPRCTLMLSTCCLLVLFVFLFLLLLLARVARVSRASSSRGSDMATATSTVEPEGEEEGSNTSAKEGQSTQSGGPESEGWKTVSKFSHPIYRKLSCLNGELNALSLNELKEKLTTLNLSSV